MNKNKMVVVMCCVIIILQLITLNNIGAYMSFSDILSKVGRGEPLTATEQQELSLEARRLEEAASIVNKIIVPGSETLRINNLVAHNAIIDGADILRATAGGGAVTLDEDGIYISDAGDAFVMEQSGTNQFYMSMSLQSQSLKQNAYMVSDPVNYIDNGDFETGDLTSWTETDAAGYIDVFNDLVKGYCLRFATGASNSQYIQQDTTSVGYSFVVKFKAKSVTGLGNLDVTSNVAGAQASLTNITTEWRNYIVFVEAPAGGTTITYIRFNSYSVPSYLLVDDIEVYPISGKSALSLDNAGATLDASSIFLMYKRGTQSGILDVYMREILRNYLSMRTITTPATTGIDAYASEARVYFKSPYFVISYLDGATLRYKYLDLSGTGVTWVHSTTAP